MKQNNLRAFMKNISANVKRIRRQRGLTQLQLSHKTRLSLSTVTEVEQYRLKNISLKTILLLSTALKTSPTHLLMKRGKT